jgi:hypothetical protein
MAKMTVLEIVQDVLNDLDGDFVNSIDDTEESQQRAAIVASTYRAMMSNRNWPHTNRTVNLTPSGTNLRPTHMTLEDNIKELISVYYDKKKNGETAIRMSEVKWKEPDDFLRYTYSRNSDNDDVVTVDDPSGVKLLILDDKAPEYFTSFDDTTLVFDSYDATVDSTLQANKTLARAYVIPSLTLSDSTIPDLPEEAFTAFVEEVKSKSAYKIKQFEDVKSEQEAARQNRWLSRKAWRAHGGVRYPDYGRKSSRRRNDPTFRNN